LFPLEVLTSFLEVAGKPVRELSSEMEEAAHCLEVIGRSMEK